MEKIIFSRRWSERAFQYCAGCQGNTIKNHTCAHTNPCTPSGCVFRIVRSPHKLPFLSCLSSSPLSELLSLLVLLPLTMLTPLRGILQFRSDTFFVKNKKNQSDITPNPHTPHTQIWFTDFKKDTEKQMINLVYWLWFGLLPSVKPLFISAPCSFLLKPGSSKTRFYNSTCPFLFVSGIQKRWVPFLIQGRIPLK